MNRDILLGKIINTHGIKGEVKILVNSSGNLFPYWDIQKIITVSDLAKKITNPIFLKISSVRYHKKFLLLKFFNYNNINEIIEIKNKYIFTTINLNDETNLDWLKYDLFNYNVFDETGFQLGRIIKLIDNNHEGLWEIKELNKDKTFFLPNNRNFILNIDHIRKKIIIKLVPGLKNE